MGDMKDLLRDAGLSAIKFDDGTGQGTGDNLPDMPTDYIQMQAVMIELAEIAAQTDHRTYVMYRGRRRAITEQDKHRDMMSRFLRHEQDANAPLIVKAKFFPEQATRFDRKTRKNLLVPGIGFALKAEIRIPDGNGGHELVGAVPHVIVNGIGSILPYVDLEPTDKGIVIHGREHHCMVIAPVKSGQPFRLIPLGLASASRCETWNRIVEGLPSRKLAKIEAIPHNLLAKGTDRYLIYKPPGLFAFVGDDEQDPDALQYYHGHVWGQTATVLKHRGRTVQVAPFDDDATQTYTQEVIFGVTLYERSVGLKYFRKAGTGGLVEGNMNIGAAPVVDPFDALGVGILSAHPFMSAGKAYAMARSELNHQNPLYAYAARHAWLDPTLQDDPRPVLDRLANIVVEALKRRLDEAKREVVRTLHYSPLPDMEQVLAGHSAEDVWNRTDGEDFLAGWIADRVRGKNFDWKAWLHRAVRTELLREIFAKAGVEPPKRRERRPRQPEGQGGNAPANTNAPDSTDPKS